MNEYNNATVRLLGVLVLLIAAVYVGSMTMENFLLFAAGLLFPTGQLYKEVQGLLPKI